jgi:hypothetical protein
LGRFSAAGAGDEQRCLGEVLGVGRACPHVVADKIGDRRVVRRDEDSGGLKQLPDPWRVRIRLSSSADRVRRNA